MRHMGEVMADKSDDTNIAIWVLARELNVKSGELCATMAGWGLGWDVSNHMKRLSPAQADETRRRMGGQPTETKPLKVARSEKKRSKTKKKTKAKKAQKAVKETVKKLKKSKKKGKKKDGTKKEKKGGKKKKGDKKEK